MLLNVVLSCQENMRKSNDIIAKISCNNPAFMKVFSAVESWTRVLDLDMLAQLLAVKCSHRLPGLKELKKCFIVSLYCFSFLGTGILDSTFAGAALSSF